MARITGRNSKIGIDVKLAASYGTATAATKAIGVDSLNHTNAAAKLFNSPIGRAESMLANIVQGAELPTLSIEGKPGFNNGYAEMIATFFGTSAAPVEQTGGQGDYLHTIKFNETRLANYLTIAAQATTTELFEWRDVAIQGLTLNYQNPFPNFISAAFDMIASERVDTAASQINTYAGLTALSAPNRDEITVQTTGRFRINSDSAGALANGDTVAVESIVVNYTDALEPTNEMSGNTYNSQPTQTDLFAGTVVVNFRSLADFTYFTAATNGTTYKADILVTGTQIGSGQNFKFQPSFPLLKVVEDPQYTYASPGINRFQVTFEMLKRSATPTGMADSYPHILLINTLATSLLA